ncbi:MAG: protein kinase [Deltaproteobacteria bacterium]|nr:protein kinase [Deltaproteobacteria bacterium]
MGNAGSLPRPGDLVADRYLIEGLLGEGGMGAVFRARHTGTEKACALKFLLPELARRPKLNELFLREARVAGRIGSHPNIVDIFDTGVDAARGVPFLAMELLAGQTLSEFLHTAGTPSPAVMRMLFEQLGGALDWAHRAGVVHRDLKPANLFLSSDHEGKLRLKVLDFGIAKILEGSERRTLTQTGTPWYCAPEQLGASVRQLAEGRGIRIAAGASAATDVWALGIIACQIVGGIEPSEYWQAETMGDLVVRVALEPRQVPCEPPGSARRLPAGFGDWFLRCTRHDAAECWQSAGEAVRALLPLPDAAAERPSQHGAGSADDETTTLRPRPAQDPTSAAVPTYPLTEPLGPAHGGALGSGPGLLGLSPVPEARASGPGFGPGALVPQDTSRPWQEGTGPPVPASRRPWAVIGGAAAVVVLVTAGVLAVSLRPRTAAEPAPGQQPAAPAVSAASAAVPSSGAGDAPVGVEQADVEPDEPAAETGSARARDAGPTARPAATATRPAAVAGKPAKAPAVPAKTEPKTKGKTLDDF